MEKGRLEGGNKMQKIIACCRHCGVSQGIFDNAEELRLKIAKIKKCEDCGTEFGFLPDGEIWNLRQEFISSEKIEENSTQDFWNMIHGSIVKVAKKKFEDGHYADATESAFKEINKRVKDIVKNKTGKELDGAGLMFNAFQSKNPIVFLDDLSSETGRNIQEGYMHIFSGAMTGIRNPKAHENITIGKERAIHFIFLASLLMNKLDESKY